MTPDSLGIWIQRAGRAGRQRETVAKAYLLVQPSVFQEVKRRNTEGEEVMEYKKVVEDALQEWVETDSCQCDVADKWFNNPGPHEGEYDLKQNVMSLTLFSALINGCCNNCARNNLESKLCSDLWSTSLAALLSCNSSFDSLQPTSSSHTGLPALTPHILFDMQDSQLQLGNCYGWSAVVCDVHVMG
jgi:hypothetical protein